MAECFPEKLRWRWNEHVCWGEGKSALNSPEDWILRYIRNVSLLLYITKEFHAYHLKKFCIGKGAEMYLLVLLHIKYLKEKYMVLGLCTYISY